MLTSVKWLPEFSSFHTGTYIYEHHIICNWNGLTQIFKYSSSHREQHGCMSRNKCAYKCTCMTWYYGGWLCEVHQHFNYILLWAGDFSAYTHPHSCACRQPAHSLGRRHTCSCPVCWHSVAHSDRCLAWSTHPSLKTQRYVRTLWGGPLARWPTRETLQNNIRASPRGSQGTQT